MMQDHLTTLVGSCDKYSGLWHVFQICFDKYWHIDTKNLVVTETKTVPNYTTTSFQTVNNESRVWGKRIKETVYQIDTPYTFFILEDYFLKFDLNEDKIIEWLKDMRRFNMNRLQISVSGHQKYIEQPNVAYHQIAPYSSYLISMQPSIWNTQYLYNVLDNSYSPWDFEIKGSRKLLKKEKRTFIDKRMPMIYFNAVRKGLRPTDGLYEFLKSEGINKTILTI